MSYIIQIGITTELTVEKKEAIESLNLSYIRDYFKKNFNSTDLYNCQED